MGREENRSAESSSTNKRKHPHLQPVGNRGRASRTDVVVANVQILQNGVLLANENTKHVRKCVFGRGHRGVKQGWQGNQRAKSSSVERKTKCRTFKASPSEAAPAGPMLLSSKLMDVTDLFVCETGEVRKVLSSEVTGGGSCGSRGKLESGEFKFRTGNETFAPSERHQARPRQHHRSCCGTS